MCENSEDYFATQAALFGNTFRNTPSVTPGSDLTLDALEAAIARMQQGWKDKRDNPLPKMEIVASRFLPEGFSVFENGEQVAIHNQATGKIIVCDMPDFLNAPREIEIEPEIKDHAYRWWADRYMPALFRPERRVYYNPFTMGETDSLSKLQDAFYRRILRMNASARCRQRHYRARRQGGKGR